MQFFRSGGQQPTSPIRRFAEPASALQRFQVAAIALALGHDYAVLDAGGSEVFRVDGKLWHIPEAMDVLDPSGNILFTVRGGLLEGKDVFTLTRDGQTIATVRHLTDTAAAQTFVIDLPDGAQARAIGDVPAHAYTLVYDGQIVATVSTPLIALRADFVVDVAPEQDAFVVAAITVCLDRMTQA